MTILTSLGRQVGLSFRSTARKSLSLTDFAELSRQRRALAKLDSRSLEDMGISRRAADAEARRPVWDVPAAWRC
ncbi:MULTISPECIES: DUF1127 domain-containing protein [Shimia]|uniref:DUF1127 domain-containing protein n=1 Tax=Shimia TaxID=573139 RepID=UPI001FB1DA14|nr:MULTISPECIES: DUF1127 domain-containing protein [Shimia]MDV4146054.1 DUF1127 domain-containing protein [Shimia sp. FJ5]